MLHFQNLNGARINLITVFGSIKYRRRFQEFSWWQRTDPNKQIEPRLSA